MSITVPRALVRTALRSQRRNVHPLGPFDDCVIAVEDREPGPHELDPTMPVFPLSIRKQTREDGRPYVKLSDYEEWGAKYRAWFKEKKGTLVDGDQDLIVTKPYQSYEAYEAFLVKFEKMSDDEKALLGHTVNKERARPFHELYGPSHYPMKEPAIATHNIRPLDIEPVTTYTFMRDASGRLLQVGDRCHIKQLKDAPPARNYLRDLEEALEAEAAEAAGEGEKTAEAAA